MEALSATASVIAVLQLSSNVVKCINGASGATTERRRLRESVRGCEHVLQLIKDELDDCEEGEGWTKLVKAIDGQGAPLARLSTALKLAQAKLQPKTGIKKVVSTLSWPFNSSEVEKLLEAIEREKSLLALVLNKDSQRLIQEIRKTAKTNQKNLEELVEVVKKNSDANDVQWSLVEFGLDRVEEAQKDLGDKMDRINASHDNKVAAKERKEILAWISHADYSARHATLLDQHREGTGVWLLNSNEYETWIENGTTLFCPGMPGAGKTILTSIVVQDIIGRYGGDDDVGIAYVYLDYLHRNDQDLKALLASVARQLCDCRSTLPGQIIELYRKHHGRGFKSLSREAIVDALQRVVALFSKTFIIIDALDECDDSDLSRTNLIRELKRIQETNSVKLLATSRHIPDVITEFQQGATLEIRAADEDVIAYLKSRADELPKCALRNAALQDEIYSAIVQACDGMFLLARLNLDSLRKKKSATAVRNTLEGLPKGSQAYHHAYEVAMNRIQGQGDDEAETARQVLSWITFAKRPLKARELEHAIAIIIGKTTFDFQNICQASDMASVCAGLVTIDEKTRDVRLVHYTAQQYLEETCDRWLPDAHPYLAEACAAYLSLEHFKNGPCRTLSQYRARLSHYPLYRYASLHWGHHVLPDAQTCQIVINFLQSQSKANAAMQVVIVERSLLEEEHLYNAEREYGKEVEWDEESVPIYGTGLHMATYFGLHAYIDTVVGSSFETPDLVDKAGRTPLSLAAKQGNQELITLLLAKGAVIESRCQEGQSPLSWAAEKGHLGALNVLIAHKADVNSSDVFGLTPAWHATLSGHEEIVACLLANGFDVEGSYDRGTNLLLLAIRNGHDRIVELLLRKGASVEGYKWNKRDSPMASAVRHDLIEIAKLLLDYNASISDEHISTASSGHSKAMVEFLQSQGADIEARDANGRTPLSLAVERRCSIFLPGSSDDDDKAMSARDQCLDTVSYLLGQGVEIETKDDEGRTPLSWAAANGFVAVVKELLTHGADVESSDNQGRTPLFYAVVHQRQIVAAQLMDHGASLDDSQKSFIMTPLLHTAARGQRATGELLLSKGMRHNQHQKTEQQLRSDEHLHVAGTFLRTGVDYFNRCELGRTPLAWAAVTWDVALIKVLLDNGADVNTTSKQGWTPLMLAAEAEDSTALNMFGPDPDPDEPSDELRQPDNLDCGAAIQLLIDRGANMEARDEKEGRTALLWAASNFREEAARLLLENGANPYAKGNDGLQAWDLSETLWLSPKVQDAFKVAMARLGDTFESESDGSVCVGTWGDEVD